MEYIYISTIKILVLSVCDQIGISRVGFETISCPSPPLGSRLGLSVPPFWFKALLVRPPLWVQGSACQSSPLGSRLGLSASPPLGSWLGLSVPPFGFKAWLVRPLLWIQCSACPSPSLGSRLNLSAPPPPLVYYILSNHCTPPPLA